MSSVFHFRLDHPRIRSLRQSVANLPIDEEYRSRLYASIELYADQLLAGPPLVNGWCDLGALQQLTLGDWNEEIMQNPLAEWDRTEGPTCR